MRPWHQSWRLRIQMPLLHGEVTDSVESLTKSWQSFMKKWGSWPQTNKEMQSLPRARIILERKNPVGRIRLSPFKIYCISTSITLWHLHTDRGIDQWNGTQSYHVCATYASAYMNDIYNIISYFNLLIMRKREREREKDQRLNLGPHACKSYFLPSA